MITADWAGFSEAAAAIEAVQISALAPATDQTRVVLDLCDRLSACSRACPVPPQDPTLLHASADRSGERARVRARVRVRLAPGGKRIA